MFVFGKGVFMRGLFLGGGMFEGSGSNNSMFKKMLISEVGRI